MLKSDSFKRAGVMFTKGTAYRDAALCLFVAYAAKCCRTRKDLGDYASHWSGYPLEMRKRLVSAIKTAFQGNISLALSGELTKSLPQGKAWKAFSAHLESLEKNPRQAFTTEKKQRERKTFEQRLLALIPVAEKSEEKIAAAFIEFMNQHK